MGSELLDEEETQLCLQKSDVWLWAGDGAGGQEKGGSVAAAHLQCSGDVRNKLRDQNRKMSPPALRRTELREHGLEFKWQLVQLVSTDITREPPVCRHRDAEMSAPSRRLHLHGETSCISTEAGHPESQHCSFLYQEVKWENHMVAYMYAQTAFPKAVHLLLIKILSNWGVVIHFLKSTASTRNIQQASY